MLKLRCLPALIWGKLGLLFILFSAGCSAFAAPDLPTPYPTEYLPTVLNMTVEAGRQAATASAQPTPTLPTATPQAIIDQPTTQPTSTQRQVTISSTPSATKPLPTPTRTRWASKTPTLTATPGIPFAEIQLSSPGPMSKVVSPLDINAYYRSIPNGYMVIELLAEPLQAGQAGRLLLSKLQRFGGGEAYWVSQEQALDFEIARVSEFAVLRFSVFDSFERLAGVNSVDLLLLSMGSNDLNPPGNLLQPIVIYEPPRNKLIQGGKLTVSGVTRPEGDEILHFELVTQDKRVVGTHDLFTTPAPDGKHIPFSTTIDYQVSETTWVRLIAYYLDPRIPGYRQLTSVVILVSP